MKNCFNVALIFILILSSVKSYSQVTISDFFQNGSIWFERYSVHSGSGKYTYFHSSIEIGSDTVINSITYKKLKSNSSASIYPQLSSYQFQVFNNGTIGGIRVSGRQVFFIRTKTLATNDPQSIVNSFPLSNEIILYDYNLTQGTTLPWKPNHSTVLAIDTVGFTTLSLARYYWEKLPNGNYVESWREGLGSSLGFFGSYRTAAIIFNWGLLCFSSPNLPGFGIPCQTLFVEDDIAAKKSVNIFPNPLEGDLLHVETTEQERVQSITIYNTLGAVAFQKNLTKATSRLVLDLPAGLYSVRVITDKDRIITKKLIKN